jgi:phage terminase large subunit-like protein
MLCLGRHPLQKWEPPVHCWASALTWELWENILLPELLTWIPVDRIVSAPPPFKKSTRRDIIIRADNGKLSRITGKAAEQGAERYQSARVHRVWLDEEHPESVWDEMQPRLLRFGGDTIATMTPLKGFTWVYGRVYEPFKTAKIPPSGTGARTRASRTTRRSRRNRSTSSARSSSTIRRSWRRD